MAKSKKGKSTQQPKGPAVVSIPVSPSAAAIRSQETGAFGIPSVQSVWRAAGGGLGGALIGATLITLMPPGIYRWLGALTGLTTGTLLASTSPAGTVTQEMGVGLLALSSGWMLFDVVQPPPVTAPLWLDPPAGG
jgi:hypothetical protein